jgi:hypothetical protein
MDHNFWSEIIQGRILYLKILIEKSQQLKNKNETTILSNLCKWLETFEIEKLLMLIKNDKNE